MELDCFALNKRNPNDNIYSKQIKHICGQEEGDFRSMMDSHLLVQEKNPKPQEKKHLQLSISADLTAVERNIKQLIKLKIALK